jgi:hypothetical protein
MHREQKDIRNKAKRRLMFSTGNDYYFYTYNTFIYLQYSKITGKKKMKDYKKLSFLIDFISDSDLIRILEFYKDSNKSLSSVDRSRLYSAYTNGLLRRTEIEKLCHIWQKTNMLRFEMNNDSTTSLWLNREEEILESLFDEQMFHQEIENTKKLNKVIPRVSSMKLETLLDRLFKNYGIEEWAIL